MSSENDTPPEEFSADAFWQAFRSRLSERIPTKKIYDFAVKNDLSSFRLDLVVGGKKNVDVITLVKICRNLDLSPAWLLFGAGTKQLSVLSDLDVVRVLQFMEACDVGQRHVIAEELGGQSEQKMAVPGQERKKAVAPSPRNKAKGHR